MVRSIAELYNVSPENVKGEIYGLNHLSFFKSITVSGREVLDELIENDDAYKKTDMRYFEKSLLRDRHSILNEYLYYYYYREKALKNILNADKTRGELIRDINREMTKELSGKNIEKDFDECLSIFEKWYGIRENNYMASETGKKRDKDWSFDIFGKDDGGYAGVALKYMEIKENNQSDDMILCVPNNGAIDGLEDSDVVEITCSISRDECTPHKMGKVDDQNFELIRRVKNYERLASKAIRERDRQTAIQALTLHPLVNSYSLAAQLTDAYIELNKEYCNGWK